MSRDLPDVVCYSQLRWDFVYQRPNHLMARAARTHRVWYVEEPVFDDDAPRLIVEERLPNLNIVRPVVPHGMHGQEIDSTVSDLLHQLAQARGIDRPIAWYYTPMAVPWTAWLAPAITVYDCMDELSAFRFAPPILRELEATLLERADIVFTGGQSLYEAKRERNPNVHAFPSAVDAQHFGTARATGVVNADAATARSPRTRSSRIGWFGVIDERMDLDLVAGIADLRPDWEFEFVGPVIKIDPATIPARPNIHLLGPRPYDDLPSCISDWDVAIMPFARNESTAFISPTKTLEYLAAGRPVVSTSIRDVVEPYGRLGLAWIADTAPEFVAAIEAALTQERAPFLAAVDAFLESRTWDDTWARMSALIDAARQSGAAGTPPEAGKAGGPASRSVVASAARGC